MMIFRRIGLGDGPTDEDHDCFGKLTNQFASEGCSIFLPNISVGYFQEQIGFFLKMIIFSYMA